MKLFYPCLVCLLFSCSTKNEQNKIIKNVEPFGLTIETHLMSELLFEGSKHYIFNDSSISIFKTYTIVGLDTNFVYFKNIKNSTIQFYLSNLKIGQMDNIYNNEEILPLSGQRIYIHYQNKKYKKSIRLFNYYSKEVKSVIDSMNILIPNEYKIEYDSLFNYTHTKMNEQILIK